MFRNVCPESGGIMFLAFFAGRAILDTVYVPGSDGIPKGFNLSDTNT
jgi:hypothetical protein